MARIGRAAAGKKAGLLGFSSAMLCRELVAYLQEIVRRIVPGVTKSYTALQVVACYRKSERLSVVDLSKGYTSHRLDQGSTNKSLEGCPTLVTLYPMW